MSTRRVSHNPYECAAPGCVTRPKARGLCPRHYMAVRRRLGTAGRCSVDTCDTPAVSNGMCDPHDAASRRYGSPTAAPGPLTATTNAGICADEEGCDAAAQVAGKCRKHYMRGYRAARAA